MEKHRHGKASHFVDVATAGLALSDMNMGGIARPSPTVLRHTDLMQYACAAELCVLIPSAAIACLLESSTPMSKDLNCHASFK